LGVAEDVSPEELEIAFRRCQMRIFHENHKVDEEQLYWAYQEIRQLFAQSRAPVDGVVSAVLLPGVYPALAGRDALGTDFDARRNADQTPRNKVVPMFRRTGASKGGANPDAASEPVDESMPDLQSVIAMPQIPEAPPALASAEDDESVLAHALPEPVPRTYARPRTIRSVIGEGHKEVVPLRANAAGSQNNNSIISEILSSSRETSGSMLAALRVELGIGIDEMAARTKIHPRHLAALEQDDFANLPAPVYYRGFVDSYLRYLGVNDSKLVSALVSRYQDRRR
jgi:hypothetical protein